MKGKQTHPPYRCISELVTFAFGYDQTSSTICAQPTHPTFLLFLSAELRVSAEGGPRRRAAITPGRSGGPEPTGNPGDAEGPKPLQAPGGQPPRRDLGCRACGGVWSLTRACLRLTPSRKPAGGRRLTGGGHPCPWEAVGVRQAPGRPRRIVQPDTLADKTPLLQPERRSRQARL